MWWLAALIVVFAPGIYFSQHIGENWKQRVWYGMLLGPAFCVALVVLSLIWVWETVTGRNFFEGFDGEID